MKKLLPALLFAALFLTFAACGDDKDEPDAPTTQKLETEHSLDHDTYLIYDIDLNKDSSSITVHNVVFNMDGKESPSLHIRVDAPCTVDKSGNVFTLAGTDIIPALMQGSTAVPFPTLRINNLKSTVNAANKTYSISFDCQGNAMGKNIDGHYENEGKLK